LFSNNHLQNQLVPNLRIVSTDGDPADLSNDHHGHLSLLGAVFREQRDHVSFVIDRQFRNNSASHGGIPPILSLQTASISKLKTFYK
jgi:hypothetical protein